MRGQSPFPSPARFGTARRPFPTDIMKKGDWDLVGALIERPPYGIGRFERQRAGIPLISQLR